MNLVDNALGIHERAIAVRNRRVELISQNIANADTPNYKARDLDFKKLIAGVEGMKVMATDKRHYEIAHLENTPDGLKFRVPFNSATDGNTVEMSVEQAQYAKATADYQATLMFLENRISGIRKALRGE
ncbi:MAG: flagellar basal body rod protein FlgB [Burkholderiaceae bacterium]|jgi:flagellar basal-body rod protein FlgB|nr:flagellar basal body rod protein FlgB [Pseudomonadota bacterium]MDP4618207.1 flagellar basal body rod protein FlgB [Burkholderiaceae bacterium]HCO58257.1 flagellar basal body rod protein FlgB [Burkholderiales bacterium]MDA1187521.1 flagellar basal body rod protein FlgB [Pseudomonadota bacterium]MDP4678618.1 flagellar basal body rod protein FlgB [Burkholderiaceae bacterium]